MDGKLGSQTGELVFDPDHAQFVMHGEKCAYFSGQPSGDIALGKGITAQAKNQRLSLSASAPGRPGSRGRRKGVLLTAVGESGMDETTQSPVEFFPGVPFTACAFQGKLYALTLGRGALSVTGNATLTALDVYGNELGEIRRGWQPTAEPCFPFPEICPLLHIHPSSASKKRAGISPPPDTFVPNRSSHQSLPNHRTFFLK